MTLLVILATFVVNAVTNRFPANGVTIGELANTVLGGVLITPANYAFAIWGVIYLGLLAYGIYQLLPEQGTNAVLRQVDYLLIAACLAQIAWVFLFQAQFFGWSVLLMGAILIPLLVIYRLLGIGLRPVSRAETWAVHVPFSIYTAWISVATIVNVASALYSTAWNGWGLAPLIWTVIMLLVGSAIGGVVALQRGDMAFVGVLLWAYGAIAVRQSTSTPIVVTVILAALILLGALLARRQLGKPSP